MLRAVYGLVDENEDMLIDALKYDLQKPSWEARGTELDALYVLSVACIGFRPSTTGVTKRVGYTLKSNHLQFTKRVGYTCRVICNSQSEWATH